MYQVNLDTLYPVTGYKMGVVRFDLPDWVPSHVDVLFSRHFLIHQLRQFVSLFPVARFVMAWDARLPGPEYESQMRGQDWTNHGLRVIKLDHIIQEALSVYY